MEQIIRPAAPLIENGMFNEAVVLMFTSLEKDKPFYMNAVKLEGQNSLQSIAECKTYTTCNYGEKGT